ncbi:flagellar motor switch protein FliN [Pseudomonas extremaustralis]|jgi:flagellar motor switch protein FliN|uniref:Flagellar motor switch protein FliN n=1 Tax=Pseudomonas extremaustralis TaxID=359110 RepID=A0A5C5Q8L8_9PSED|nr:flagellar motor switch protein FliN [Pseudomonas extremaustralis]EZI24811.1 flagellar motor switch protein FliN [Pseudomonas extremaustralis 14-3 substr. 14-3b]MDB1109522.1 flagellar motor switch protein FliN [Pseudomonas extremaustralis]MDF3134060.1 flagellar motor switch protein FliN [Pseudomonas extremaustralis]MDG2969940.1 flagellar motor switch protein FliN [Pseudomonas extremaustralis]TWS00886.1 flagellar motor switch protein FliN [Pseudomonas extremaustralis]
MTDSNTVPPQEPDEWADALAEQAADAADAGDDDPWAAALAEQEQVEAAVAGPAPSAGSSLFKPLPTPTPTAAARELEMIMDIPVKLSVELGRTRITIKQLLELAQGSVLALDGLAGEPMDILINSYLIAQGEVVVVDDKYGIRITEIITPSERVQKLNR